MAAKLFKYRNLQGGVTPINSDYLAGEALAAGEPVYLHTDGKVYNCADAATATLGWSLSNTASGARADIVEGFETIVATMPYIGTPATPGHFVGLDLTTGVYSVNMDDVTNELYIVRTVDTTNVLCEVTVKPACKQLGATEV